ncbi:igE-binding protein-like [Grammomys surdaster]|uniref:igE-binding protein-like n=1 Tax=Grammomys surdaster TaxID=491861 RepID=UPI00109F2701|nr:igE-binding protein-like [Grammomys surdaster]
MTPSDWSSLARACLSPGQYLDWKAFLIEYTTEQAATNQRNGNPAWDRDMLLGQGRFANQQTGYPVQVFEQVNQIAIKAWKSLPNKGEVSGNLTEILQGIVERAHRTLKECLQKQKGGVGQGRAPKERISLALFTLNFLNLDVHGRSAVDRHQNSHGPSRSMVKWKDVLMGSWRGPDPVLTGARGSVCVFPQDQQDPVWVPERLVRKVRHEDPPEARDDDGDSDTRVRD